MSEKLTSINRISKKLHVSQTGLRKYIFVYVSLIPILVLYFFLRVVPILKNFFYSMFYSKIGQPTFKFVGLQNFKDLFSDKLFLLSLKNTTIFALFVTVFSVIIALGVAISLANDKKTGPFLETVYFLPVITPMVPVAVVWKWIYDPSYGLLNYLLSIFGIQPVAWLVYPNTALMAIIIMSVWKVIGYNMIILLVGIRDIPKIYIEAARIDGASRKDILRKIIFPLLKPIMLFVFVISTINSYNVFTQVYIMTTGSQGAPGNSVTTLVLDIYQNAFRYFRTGYAASEAVVLFIIILFLTYFQFKVSGEEKEEKRLRKLSNIRKHEQIIEFKKNQKLAQSAGLK